MRVLHPAAAVWGVQGQKERLAGGEYLVEYKREYRCKFLTFVCVLDLLLGPAGAVRGVQGQKEWLAEVNAWPGTFAAQRTCVCVLDSLVLCGECRGRRSGWRR